MTVDSTSRSGLLEVVMALGVWRYSIAHWIPSTSTERAGADPEEDQIAPKS